LVGKEGVGGRGGREFEMIPLFCLEFLGFSWIFGSLKLWNWRCFEGTKDSILLVNELVLLGYVKVRSLVVVVRGGQLKRMALLIQRPRKGVTS